jgi:hypothetical protein
VHVVAVSLGLSVRRRRLVTECLMFLCDPVQSVEEHQKTKATSQFQGAPSPRLMAALSTSESSPDGYHAPTAAHGILENSMSRGRTKIGNRRFGLMIL